MNVACNMNFTSNVKQYKCKSYLDWSQRGGRVQCRHQSNTKQDDDAVVGRHYRCALVGALQHQATIVTSILDARLDDNVSVANFGLRVDQHEGAWRDNITLREFILRLFKNVQSSALIFCTSGLLGSVAAKTSIFPKNE